MSEFDNREQDVFAKRVRAGKRTYFFDVKTTRSGDYYIAITESKKRMEDGVFVKHKIFLYKEDFDKFSSGLKETVEFVKANQEVIERTYEERTYEEKTESTESTTEVNSSSSKDISFDI